MSDPLVSVIVTVKNGERFLPAALGSIRSQRYQPLEIIVVDGQSVDSTAQIAMTAENVRYFRQDDEGLASGRNRGIHEARGDLIAFLDADDEWLPGKLRRQVDYLRDNPGPRGTITRLRFLIGLPESGAAVLAGKHYYGDMVGYTPGTLVAQKDLVQHVGAFDPALSIACDADWFSRMLDAALPVAVLPDVLLIKRIHDRNMSLQRDRVRHETMTVLRRSLGRKRRGQQSPSNGNPWRTPRSDSGNRAADSGDAR